MPRIESDELDKTLTKIVRVIDFLCIATVLTLAVHWWYYYGK